DDDVRLEHAPVLEHHGTSAAGVLLDARNRRVGENLDARVAAGGRHRRGDRTHAADDVAGVTLPRFLVAAAQQVKQEPHGGAGLVRTPVLAVQAVRKHQALDRIGPELAVEEIPERAGEKTQQRPDLVARDAAKAPADAHKLENPRDALPSRVGRRLEEERLQPAGKPLELVLDLEES